MTDILVVNHGLHQVCGVHDLGRRLYHAIPDSIASVYVEGNDAADLVTWISSVMPRVVLVNYRADLMPWMDAAIGQASGPLCVAVAHNYEPHTLAALHQRHQQVGFDLTLALEPQSADVPGVVWSGRPMPPPTRIEIPAAQSVTVGSFGFAFGHKRFDLVAREVAALGEPAVLRLHAPTAHFGGSDEQTEAVVASVRAELVGSDVTLSATFNHHGSHSLVDMLARCHVNCLLYDPGQPDAGLSSALDYLLAAGRPILVSEASMFRHALPAALTWPEHRLVDVLADQDRHAVNVRERYDQLTQGYATGIRQLLER